MHAELPQKQGIKTRWSMEASASRPASKLTVLGELREQNRGASPMQEKPITTINNVG